MVELLAKPDVPLIKHLEDVTALGAKLADQLGLLEPLRTKAILACALHDIGKAVVDFQKYIRGARRQSYPHALASLPFVLCVEMLIGRSCGWDSQHLEATAAVVSHHSPLGPQLYKGYEVPRYDPELSQALQAVWDLLSRYGVKGFPPVSKFLQDIQPWLTGPTPLSWRV